MGNIGAPEEANNVVPEKGMSPYPTGGGGVTFERKVAVMYLAHLLVGDGAAELGNEHSVVSVAFQQAPHHPVDDLVVAAARANESEPSLVLALGVRRSPDLVKSDESTQKLIRDFVRAVASAPVEGPEHRFALVVAGPQIQAKQLASLADLAVVQAGAAAFFDLVRTPNKFERDVRGRLDQIEGLVEWALNDLGTANLDAGLVQQRTWELLSRLTVLMPRLEAPDEADWMTVVNSLIRVARGGDLTGASGLRDRLVALANEYSPKAATVDRTVLRRGAHSALEESSRRNKRGWQALGHLKVRAVSSVRDEIRSVDGVRCVHLDRGDIAAQVIAAARAGVAVVVHGESGVGKSSIVLGAATFCAAANPDVTQVVCINLRHLPGTTLEFEDLLGCRLEALLAELSAPQRLLVIDGADAVAENMLEGLRYLVDAACTADVGVVAITATDNMQVVRDTVAERLGSDVVEHVVPGLTDTEVDEAVAIFGELGNLAESPRSRELLRRPVVIDLLVRGGVAGVPLSDADTMQQVWLGLVRCREQSDRGTPDARDFAMLRLADLALSGGDPLDAVGAIDANALDGLRRDGLLRTPIDDPFRIGPEFAHDEVRRYAVARLLSANTDPTTKLLAAGVPRWALGAARLACQVLLGSPSTLASPLHGRFARLQAAFDALVSAGHDERWGDVPGEALLTLGDPDPVLRDAWAGLRAESDHGLQRLGRLIDQRLRDKNGLIRSIAVEPLVNLLLDDATPWWSGDHVLGILRGWLRALVVERTQAGHPSRDRLRARLVAACAAADARVEAEQAAAVAARAARSPEEIEEDRQFMEQNRHLFTSIGYPQSRRRPRPEIPREITDEIVVELFALLGPDLGDDGDAILRRVGQAAPARLAPALEKVLVGNALAMCGRGLLAELTEAYYIDDEECGSGLIEDGIRDHDYRDFGIIPLAAYYRGPFMALLQTDFCNGVAALNRILNHAALARAQTLANLHRAHGAPIYQDDLAPFRTEFEITGERRVYVGDGHVWMWYRGTGVGPSPCMSGLQALERGCDQLIELGIPIQRIVSTLLEDCENLAIVGLVVGLLVRHLERADRLVDPYLADPAIWRHEFGRTVNESSGLAASSVGIAGGERRTWSLREAAMYLVLCADEARVVELRIVGEKLVENASRLIGEANDDPTEDESADVDNAAFEEQLAIVRGWASGLDRDTYHVERTDAGVSVQSVPSDDVAQALQRGNEQLNRFQEAMRLIVRYVIEPKNRVASEVQADELSADLSLARDLLDNPPDASTRNPWDGPSAVSAAALLAHLIDGVALADDLLTFAVDTVLRVAAGEPSPPEFEHEQSYFEQAADRSAAKSLPLLLLPSARPLLELVAGEDGASVHARVVAAGMALARAAAYQVRLYLARVLDQVWRVPCAEGTCRHHQVALQVALESMRDSAFGEWDPVIGRRRTRLLNDPIEAALAEIPGDALYVSRLDAAIRALAPAAVSDSCISVRARAALDVAVVAQRRWLMAHEQNVDERGTHALVAARAALALAARGDDALIFDHIEAFGDMAVPLGSFLRALSSAAEETEERAAAARRLWPEIVERVLELNASGHTPFDDRYFGELTIASLIPTAAGDVSYLYRELDGDPIMWWDPLGWSEIVERWLDVAVGKATCVDHLLAFLSVLPRDEQVRIGMPWVTTAVLADPACVAARSTLLCAWLVDSRAMASDGGLLPDWQRVVDALVVAGASQLASYSE